MFTYSKLNIVSPIILLLGLIAFNAEAKEIPLVKCKGSITLVTSTTLKSVGIVNVFKDRLEIHVDKFKLISKNRNLKVEMLFSNNDFTIPFNLIKSISLDKPKNSIAILKQGQTWIIESTKALELFNTIEKLKKKIN